MTWIISPAMREAFQKAPRCPGGKADERMGIPFNPIDCPDCLNLALGAVLELIAPPSPEPTRPTRAELRIAITTAIGEWDALAVGGASVRPSSDYLAGKVLGFLGRTPSDS